jgi:NADPH:quinone reductase-like Zn-dependent oxidoreductase
VDERIVGHKPKSLGHAEAAALPLTTITAYKAFFDRLGGVVTLTQIESFLPTIANFAMNVFNDLVQ